MHARRRWCRRTAGSRRPARRLARTPATGAGRSWERLEIPAAAHHFEPGHRGVGALLVGLLDDEAHVDDHPVSWCERLFGHHADVDLAVLTRNVDEGQLAAIAVQHLHDPAGNT